MHYFCTIFFGQAFLLFKILKINILSQTNLNIFSGVLTGKGFAPVHIHDTSQDTEVSVCVCSVCLSQFKCFFVAYFELRGNLSQLTTRLLTMNFLQPK